MVRVDLHPLPLAIARSAGSFGSVERRIGRLMLSVFCIRRSDLLCVNRKLPASADLQPGLVGRYAHEISYVAGAEDRHFPDATSRQWEGDAQENSPACKARPGNRREEDREERRRSRAFGGQWEGDAQEDGPACEARPGERCDEVREERRFADADRGQAEAGGDQNVADCKVHPYRHHHETGQERRFPHAARRQWDGQGEENRSGEEARRDEARYVVPLAVLLIGLRVSVH
jgi:hypothetical protein